MGGGTGPWAIARQEGRAFGSSRWTSNSNGKLTLRQNSRLHHIGIGRRHAGTNVLVLVHDLHIRVVNTDGELLRELQLNPTKDYQPQPKA